MPVAIGRKKKRLTTDWAITLVGVDVATIGGE